MNVYTVVGLYPDFVQSAASRARDATFVHIVKAATPTIAAQVARKEMSLSSFGPDADPDDIETIAVFEGGRLDVYEPSLDTAEYAAMIAAEDAREAALNVNDLVEGCEAAGLKVIVFDEDTPLPGTNVVELRDMDEWRDFAAANEQAIIEACGSVEWGLRHAIHAGLVLGGGAAPLFEVRFSEPEDEGVSSLRAVMVSSQASIDAVGGIEAACRKASK